MASPASGRLFPLHCRRDSQLSSSEGYPPPHLGRHSTSAYHETLECELEFIQHRVEGIQLDTTALHHDFQGHVQDFQQFQQETVGELAATHALAEENDRCWDDVYRRMGWRYR